MISNQVANADESGVSKMKSIYLCKALPTIAIVFLTSACGQSLMSESVPGTRTAIVEQDTWKQLTANADVKLKSGDTAEAESLYKLAILEAEKLGVDNLGQATALANLANFYYVQGDGNQADQLYKKSLALHEKKLGG